MPFVVSVGLLHAGESYPAGSVVSDEVGAAMLADHPSHLARVQHDMDLAPHLYPKPEAAAPSKSWPSSPKAEG